MSDYNNFTDVIGMGINEGKEIAKDTDYISHLMGTNTERQHRLLYGEIKDPIFYGIDEGHGDDIAVKCEMQGDKIINTIVIKVIK